VTGLWLASYLALCALVVVMCLLDVGLLRQIGLLQRRLGQVVEPSPPPAVPPLEHDGPAIGSHIPHLVAETVNGFGPVALDGLRVRGGVLVMFMAPMCESCQHIVELLNALAEDSGRAMQTVVIMRGDEHAYNAFLRVFPLRVPIIGDGDRKIHKEVFNIHRSPLGLLYDENGTLVRKGIVTEHADLLALLGDASASESAQIHVFPHLHPQLVSS